MLGIISVTKKGDSLGEKVQKSLGGDLYKKSSNENFSLDKVTNLCFNKYKYLVFISSTGIAVRAIAKYLEGKDKDPAVVVVDVCNKFSISLVSGHLGGANKLTDKVANILGNTPVITTATDNMQIDAPDMVALENNLIIEDLKKAKIIAGRLVNKEVVYFKDDNNLISCPKGYINSDEVVENTLWITNKNKSSNNVLKLIRRNIILGIGCRRNTDSEVMYDFIKETLERNNIDIRAVKTIATIDIKHDEVAILSLVDRLNTDFKLFTKEEISKVDHKYEGSDFVKKNVGVRSVCEPVVDLSEAEILINKIKNNGMTLCIGQLK